METTFCTIITYNYIPYALTLFNSISKYNTNIELNVFIADRERLNDINTIDNINMYSCEHLCMEGIGSQLHSKYEQQSIDNFRWSMKPVFINYLILKKKYKKVLYVDPDIYFFNNYHFLFDELNNYDIILSPHWRSSDPHADSNNFHINFSDGFFNGGFIGVNVNGVKAMDWWAMVCYYACEKDISKGLYDDQGYLNLLQIYFDNIGIIRHMGCNVANWNMYECKRTLRGDGTVLINDEYPIVFVHFTSSTIRDILIGIDSHLYPHLDEYTQELLKHNPKLNIIAEYRNRVKRKHENNNIISFVKNKIR
jgi:hypothetical protein